MSDWKKLEPYEGEIHQGCPHCTPVERIAPMDMVVMVGFGLALIEKDCEIVYDESNYSAQDAFPTLAVFEEIAAADPDYDWRCVMDAPLRGREYQRQGAGKWVLIRSDQGFA